LLLIRYAARVRLAEIGFYRWRDWTTSEKAYLIQIVPLAIAIFAMIAGSRLQAIAAEPSIWTTAALTSVSYLVWGFYQEVMYRGILQTEMVRRFGTAAGVVVANLAYTFGPLHLYYFKTYDPPMLFGLFAAVFLVGLFFGALFHRSGNLVIVGVLHGIGDVFLTGLPQLA
jgi:membrane protease YdiL (CAAX protease family)